MKKFAVAYTDFYELDLKIIESESEQKAIIQMLIEKGYSEPLEDMTFDEYLESCCDATCKAREIIQ